MTDTDSSNTDPMAAARRLLGADNPGDVETATESEGGVVETDNTAEDTEVISEDELLEEAAQEVSAYDRPGKWFVVHTQSGYEKKVKQNQALHQSQKTNLRTTYLFKS